MARYLLDTNIIRNVIKPEPSQALLAWLGAQKDEDLFIASLTVAEIQRGILEKPPGGKRSALDTWFSGPEGPRALFARRNLSRDYRFTFTTMPGCRFRPCCGRSKRLRGPSSRQESQPLGWIAR